MFFLVYLAVILLGLYMFLGRNKQKGKPLPGPKGWPFIGMGLEMTQRNMFDKLSEYARQYGDIIQVKIYGNTMVVLNSSETIKSAFAGDPYKRFMNDRRKMYFAEKFMFKSASLAFTQFADSDGYKDHKKSFVRGLRYYGDGRNVFEETVQNTLRGLVKKIQSNGDSEFILQDTIKSSITDNMSILISGHVVESEEDLKAINDLDNAQGFFLNARADLMMRMFPFVRWFPWEYRTRYKEMTAAQERILNTYYENAKATYQPGVIRGLFDFMLHEQQQALETGGDVLYTDNVIKAQTLEIFSAGVATSVTTMSSIFLCLLNHPECQVKIQQEIDRVIGRDRMPTVGDKIKCPMIEAVILETTRYAPTAPGLLPHDCRYHIEFEGYDIPTHSMIIANVYHITHDEKIWGDPWTFRPERFLDENGEVVPNDDIFRNSLLTFGTGRRHCPGEAVGRTRLFLFLATILQRWTLEFPPGRETTCDPRIGDYEIGAGLRANPFFCRAVPREPAV